MTVADLKARWKRFGGSAEMIFDREEPIGTPTDLVMPRKRWFRRGVITPPNSFAPAPKRS